MSARPVVLLTFANDLLGNVREYTRAPALTCETPGPVTARGGSFTSRLLDRDLDLGGRYQGPYENAPADVGLRLAVDLPR